MSQTDTPVCAYDNTEVATHFCYCAEKVLYLCEAHVSAHEDTHSPGEFYFPLPLIALDDHTNFGYYDRVRSHKEAASKGIEEVLDNLSAIDQCIEELSRLVETVICQLNDYAMKKVSELLAARANLKNLIEAGKRELQASLYVEAPVTNVIALALCNYTPLSGAIQLFHYSLRQDLFPKSLDQLLTFAVVDPVPQKESSRSQATTHLLPRVENNSISYFNFERKIWRSISRLTADIPRSGYRYTLVTDDKLFVCGGWDGKVVFKYAAEIDENGTVKQWADMTIERFAHGMIFLAHYAYVFGGETTGKRGNHHSDIADSERYNLWTQAWESLPAMPTIRKNFNPVPFFKGIFLCGGGGSINIDVFEPQSMRMRTLNLQLPESSAASLCFEYQNQLVIILRNTVSMFRVKEEQLTFRGTLRHDNDYEPYAKTAPVVYGTKLFAANGMKCVVYEVVTGKHLAEIDTNS